MTKGKPMPPGREARTRTATRDVRLAEPGAGAGIVRASWIGTGLLALTSIAAAVDPHDLAVPALVVALAEFFGGIGVFFWAYAVAAGRSRELEITVAGVFGLAGSAPVSVQRRLYVALVVEAVVGFGCFAAQPNSSLSFAILATVWGVGWICCWGARHGAFPPRVERSRPRRRA